MQLWVAHNILCIFCAQKRDIVRDCGAAALNIPQRRANTEANKPRCDAVLALAIMLECARNIFWRCLHV